MVNRIPEVPLQMAQRKQTQTHIKSISKALVATLHETMTTCKAWLLGWWYFSSCRATDAGARGLAARGI